MSNIRIPLSREFFKREYKAECKERLKHTIGAYCVLFFLGAIGALLGMALMNFSVIFGAIFLGVFLLTAFLPVWALLDELIILIKINKGKFSIVEDEVANKSEGEVSDLFVRRFSFMTMSSRFENALYFAHYGRYLPKKTVFSMTDQWDTFYLVVLDGRKPRILAAYHSDMYDGEGCC